MPSVVLEPGARLSPRAAGWAPPAAHAYADAHLPRFVGDLAGFVRIPSVSAEPARRPDVRRAAMWLVERLRNAGIRPAGLVETGGAPFVCGHLPAPAGRPTLLVYGHYDVQPAAPADGWSVAPFGGVVRDGRLYGRGATDDKGQVLAHVAALESLLRTGGTPPVGVLLIVEGEEESGSGRLLEALRRTGRALPAHAAVVSDTAMRSSDRPALVERLRGQVGFEIEVRTLPADVHSGAYGGTVADAAAVLARLTTSLHRPNGEVAVPGFYNAVRIPATAARARLARDGPGDAELLRPAGAGLAVGEPGWSAYERTILRPAITVASLQAGWAGPGLKAVVPAHARAMLDLRLVPDQTPDEITALVHDHLRRRAPAAAEVRVRRLTASRPVVLDLDHPVAGIASAALARAFGSPPARIGRGGSIPAIEALVHDCGIPVVAMGFATPEAAMHGPDEHMALSTFARAVHAIVDLVAGLRAWKEAPR